MEKRVAIESLFGNLCCVRITSRLTRVWTGLNFLPTATFAPCLTVAPRLLGRVAHSYTHSRTLTVHTAQIRFASPPTVPSTLGHPIPPLPLSLL